VLRLTEPRSGNGSKTHSVFASRFISERRVACR